MRKTIHSISEVLDVSTLSSIIIISLLTSVLALAIPIAAQTLINLIAFGKLLQPVITLSVIVLVVMIALGALNIWQSIIIEIIQQKLMVKISLNLTQHFTELSLHNFSTHNGPELVNRFFEIATINKALTSILMYGINLGLQLIFGLVLLIFYHPIFLVFDSFIIVCVVIIILLPYRKGLKSANDECYSKHQVGAWLEELLRNRFLFRFSHYYEYAIQQTDKRLVTFLKARNIHFKQLIKHQIGFHILSALASSLLLGLGGYLVIQNQLSLGQLVAAEIVLGALIYGFKRFGALLENYYDLLASQDKIDEVLNLPCEAINTDLSQLLFPIEHLILETKENQKSIVDAKNPLLICSQKANQDHIIGEFILGFKNSNDIHLLVNDVICQEEHRRSLRRSAMLIRNNEWFSGSLYDNLRLHQPCFSVEKLKELLIAFGLMDKLVDRANGLKNIIYDWASTFTQLELTQLMIIRAILANPQLIILDRLLDTFNSEDVELLLTQLGTLDNSLLIIITQNPDLFKIPNRLVLT